VILIISDFDWRCIVSADNRLSNYQPNVTNMAAHSQGYQERSAAHLVSKTHTHRDKHKARFYHLIGSVIAVLYVISFMFLSIITTEPNTRIRKRV
jgi:hypothetical protein